MKNKVYIQHLHKINMTEDCNDGNLYIPHNLKKKQEKNSTISIIKSLRILIFRTLASKCGKIISRKLVLRVATQLKARFLHKATENQPARESQINVKFYVIDHKIRQN